MILNLYADISSTNKKVLKESKHLLSGKKSDMHARTHARTYAGTHVHTHAREEKVREE